MLYMGGVYQGLAGAKTPMMILLGAREGNYHPLFSPPPHELKPNSAHNAVIF